MSELDKQIADALDNGAEYLAMGEIVAHTGLLVSQSPRNFDGYEIIVNNVDMSKGCLIKVKHSREQFKFNVKNTGYDFVVFVYAPSNIENGIIKPKYGRATDQQGDTDKKRGIYIFPKEIIQSSLEGESGTTFNPKNIQVNGVKDKEKYKEYRNAFHLIQNMVPNSPPDFV